MQLKRIGKRISENHRIPFTYDDDVVSLIASRCTEVESGARVVDTILTDTVLPRISQEFLTRVMEGKPLDKVTLKRDNHDFAYGFE